MDCATTKMLMSVLLMSIFVGFISGQTLVQERNSQVVRDKQQIEASYLTKEDVNVKELQNEIKRINQTLSEIREGMKCNYTESMASIEKFNQKLKLFEMELNEKYGKLKQGWKNAMRRINDMEYYLMNSLRESEGRELYLKRRADQVQDAYENEYFEDPKIPGLNEQILYATSFKNWNSTKLYLKQHLRNTSEAYKQLQDGKLNTDLPWRAAERGYPEILKVLLENGLDVNLTDGSHCTMLHEATKSGHKNVVSLLISKNAFIDAKDIVGKTPLHYAAQNGHLNISIMLLNKGADTKAHDFAGNTPLDLAKSYEQWPIAKLLIEVEERIDEPKKRKSSENLLYFIAIIMIICGNASKNQDVLHGSVMACAVFLFLIFLVLYDIFKVLASRL